MSESVKSTQEKTIGDCTQEEIRTQEGIKSMLWKINIDDSSSFEDLLSLCSKFPKIDEVVDYDTGLPYYLKAKLILDEIEDITTNEPSKKEQFDIITNGFNEYASALNIHINKLKTKQQSQKRIIEESKKYGGTIAANLD